MVVPLFGRIVVSDYLRSSHWSTEPGGGATGRNAASWLVEREEERNGSWCSFVAIVRFWCLIGQNCRQIKTIGFSSIYTYQELPQRIKKQMCVKWFGFLGFRNLADFLIFVETLATSPFVELIPIFDQYPRQRDLQISIRWKSMEIPISVWIFSFFSSEWFLLCLTIS